ncbi:MAG: hypothetical protein KF729_20175 [Sandaracinaceae bacterium]|nr:hypothetical protein [Sandaracinaceae bacterium]
MQGEVQLVRETLEGIVEPSIATSVLFESLSRWGRGVPRGPEQVLELVQGPVRELLERRIGPSAGPALDALIAQLEAIAAGDELEVEIDFDEPEEPDGALTAQMLAVSVPVVVLVVAGYREFATRLTASIGRERVHTLTVGDVEELRRTTFSASPQVVVVDAAQPAAIRTADLARALKDLPDRVISFVWGEDTSYGRELRARAEQLGASALYLDRGEGIEPLLDLILSRYKTTTIPPPADE